MFLRTTKSASPSLSEPGGIDVGLAKRPRDWAGLRNVLVHMYLRIDPEVIWQTLEQDLPDIEEYIQVCGSLLAES